MSTRISDASPKASSPLRVFLRETEADKQAADKTSTGTASSMAAWIVQRPSPEILQRSHCTRRASGSVSAIAVRSNATSLTTLPRRTLLQCRADSDRSEIFGQFLAGCVLEDVEALA